MKTQVIITPTNGSLQTAIEQCFLPFNGNGHLLKGKIFIKVNLCTTYRSAITNPDVVVALINYLKDHGKDKHDIIVFENSACTTPTRLVALIDDFGKKIRQTGAKLIYLDETPSRTENFEGTVLRDPIPFPKIISEALIDHRNENTYINVPKLKTHCQTGVTICMKNQHGLLYDKEKLLGHHQIDEKMIDIWKKIHPDFNIVDATTIINHGSIPYRPEWVIPMNVLIAGTDGVAVDTVGAELLGISEVPILKLAARDKLGQTDINQMEILPDQSVISRFRIKCNADPQKNSLPISQNIQILIGKSWEGCPAGCRSIFLILPMIYTYQNPKPVICILGRGHDLSYLDQQKGPFLVIGPCSVNELRPYFTHRKDQTKIKVVFLERHFDVFELMIALIKLAKFPMSILNKMFQLPLHKVFGAYTSAMFHGARKTIKG